MSKIIFSPLKMEIINSFFTKSKEKNLMMTQSYYII